MKVVATSKNIKPITKADKLYEQFMDKLRMADKCPICYNEIEIAENKYQNETFQLVKHCPHCGWHKFYE